MKTIGQKIKEARIARGLTMEEFAKLAGFSSRQSVYKVESGVHDVPRKRLPKICDVLGLKIEELADDRNEISAVPIPGILRSVPVYDFCSAGLGAVAYDYPIDHITMSFASQAEADNTIVLRVVGDSMLPKIEDGDLIQVEKNQFVPDGKVGVFLLGDEAVVKRVQYSDNFVMLCSFNPAYPPRVFSPMEWTRDVVTQGIVKKVIKDL